MHYNKVRILQYRKWIHEGGNFYEAERHLYCMFGWDFWCRCEEVL